VGPGLCRGSMGKSTCTVVGRSYLRSVGLISSCVTHVIFTFGHGESLQASQVLLRNKLKKKSAQSTFPLSCRVYVRACRILYHMCAFWMPWCLLISRFFVSSSGACQQAGNLCQYVHCMLVGKSRNRLLFPKLSCACLQWIATGIGPATCVCSTCEKKVLQGYDSQLKKKLYAGMMWCV